MFHYDDDNKTMYIVFAHTSLNWVSIPRKKHQQTNRNQ